MAVGLYRFSDPNPAFPAAGLYPILRVEIQPLRLPAYSHFRVQIQSFRLLFLNRFQLQIQAFRLPVCTLFFFSGSRSSLFAWLSAHLSGCNSSPLTAGRYTSPAAVPARRLLVGTHFRLQVSQTDGLANRFDLKTGRPFPFLAGCRQWPQYGFHFRCGSWLPVFPAGNVSAHNRSCAYVMRYRAYRRIVL